MRLCGWQSGSLWTPFCSPVLLSICTRFVKISGFTPPGGFLKKSHTLDANRHKFLKKSQDSNRPTFGCDRKNFPPDAVRGTLVERVDQSFLKSFKAIQRIYWALCKFLTASTSSLKRTYYGKFCAGKSNIIPLSLKIDLALLETSFKSTTHFLGSDPPFKN
jgi:hypothetical protein